ncbi:MAG: hypothetical protein H7840_10630 [Alphaproteobacteria bacterium]
MTDHIQIGDVSPRIQYVANGSQTAFPYPFPIFATGDISADQGNLKYFAIILIIGRMESVQDWAAARREGRAPLGSHTYPPSVGLTASPRWSRRTGKIVMTSD